MSQTWLGSGVAVAVALLAAVAPIGAIAWENPYAMGTGVALERKKKRVLVVTAFNPTMSLTPEHFLIFEKIDF